MADHPLMRERFVATYASGLRLKFEGRDLAEACDSAGSRAIRTSDPLVSVAHDAEPERGVGIDANGSLGVPLGPNHPGSHWLPG